MNKQNKAFTLVELIVVITILAILWTIAFISLQWYSKDTRNSVRLSDLSNIDKTLWIKLVTAWKVPVPYNKIDITASGTIFIYQWNAWERVLEVLWVSNWWKDPKDEIYYTYATNTSLNKYQLIWFMEWDAIASNSIVNNSYAVTDLTERSIITKWDELWILLDATTNVPLVNGIDVATTTTSYKAIFEEDILVEGTGWVLFSNYYNRDKVLLADKELAKLDDSLVWYWDMETLTGWLLKDFSQYWNNGVLNWWIVVWWESAKNWNSTYFDGFDDYIEINNSESLDITSNLTISAWFYQYDSTDSRTFLNKDDVSALWRSWTMFIRDSTHWTIPNSAGFEMHDTLSYDWPIESIPNIINQWYFNHIAITFDNLYNWTIYVNWIEKWSKLNGIPLNSVSTSIKIWARISPNPLLSWYTTWIIDEVRIYNRALSDNEVKTLYEATK
jgi:prepilin-type N-terminal cleavage/methylation domain-containing protein